jgi:PAS domain S-box-containing protein
MQNTNIWLLNSGVLLTDASASTMSPNAIHTGVSIKDFMHMPVSFWVLDTKGTTITINAEGASICGFKSEQDAIGKSLINVSKKESAIQLIDNCREVIQTKQAKMYDEVNIRQDGIQQQFLSIKVPLYDQNQNIMGVFGVSIVLGRHSLANSLNFLQQIGMISNAFHVSSPCIQPRPMALPKRELECLQYIIQGYTAKMIAREVGLSFRTIESYIRNLKNRLGVSTRFELIQMAKKQKLYGI